MLSATAVALSLAASAIGPAGCAAVVGVEDFTVDGEGSGAGASASSGGPMIDVCEEVHGCTRNMAFDYTIDPGSTVGVGFNEKGYDPPCIRILNGKNVNFNSSTHTFIDYPIAGGIAPDVDPMSPIKETTSAAKAMAFTISGGCGFPFFSTKAPDTHKGAIFVGGLSGTD
jgi:hypothetical protein